MPVALQGATSGSVTLTAPAVAGSNTTTVPARTGNLAIDGPAFGAYQSSAQSALSANTWTKVSLQTEEFDTDNCFDSTTNYRFTPNVAGYYQVNAAGQFTNASSALDICAIYKNGSSFKQGGYMYMPSFNSSGNLVTVSALIQMNGTTDYLEFWMFCDTARSIQTGQNCTYFNGFLARAA